MKRILTTFGAVIVALFVSACGENGMGSQPAEDPDLFDDTPVEGKACRKATAAQVAVVNRGNSKKTRFLQKCAAATQNSPWCNQVLRPNPSSIAVFRCTYGEEQVHQLIHPDESTWKHAFNAIKLMQDLEQKGFRIQLIYNWWRPEPYNANVGGAAGRHPFATSVDVRFTSNAQADQAFFELCDYRKEGRIRAIGHYGTNALHFGMGDSVGNTWGKTCP